MACSVGTVRLRPALMRYCRHKICESVKCYELLYGVTLHLYCLSVIYSDAELIIDGNLLLYSNIFII